MAEARPDDRPDPLDGDWNASEWWTTTNLGEALPGILTPLTWSFCGPAMERAVRRGFAAIGANPRSEVRQPDDTRRWGIGIFMGRTAVNVDFLGRLADRLPGTSGAAMAEQWFGAVPEGFHSRPVRRRYPIVAARLPWAFATAPRRVRRVLDQSKRWWREETNASDSLSLAEAQAQLARAGTAYEHAMTAHIAAQMAALQPLFEAVQRLTAKAGCSHLTDRLLASHELHAETEVVEGLWLLSRDQLSLDAFLAAHGCEAPLNGELSSPSWREDPSPVEQLIETYRTLPDTDAPAAARERRALARAEAVSELLGHLPRLSRGPAKLTLHLHAGAIPLRGIGKAACLRALDVGRSAARRVGDLLVQSGGIDQPDDVFYLTVEEIGVATPASRFQERVADRRRQRDAYLEVTLPTSWRGRPTPVPRSEGSVERSDVVLKGHGASAGVVEANVRVLHDPAFGSVESGEILVAPFTDPGWASVMFVAAGLVVDIGGLQSHAAVVARELGIPCVMGVGDATTRLRTGDRCRVDGSAGTVELLSPVGRVQTRSC